MTNPTVPSATSPEIEFWFEFGSNYSYLSVMRIEEAARRQGVRIVWKAFLLGPIFRALGLENSPFVLQKEKGVYMQQDMTRLCRKYGLAPWVKPSVFPRLGVLPLRIVLLGGQQPWVGAFSRKVMELNFALDKDINYPDQMAPKLTGLGLPSSDRHRSGLFKGSSAAPCKQVGLITPHSQKSPADQTRRAYANKQTKPAREGYSIMR